MPHKKVFHIAYRLQKSPLLHFKSIITLKYNKLRIVKIISLTAKFSPNSLVFKELEALKTAKVGRSGASGTN